jgi:hypothetical protein
MRRFPEIADRLERSVVERDAFFTSIVDAGVASGEVRACDQAMVAEFIRVMLIGLTEGVSESPEQHRLAIDAIRALLRGELIAR